MSSSYEKAKKGIKLKLPKKKDFSLLPLIGILDIREGEIHLTSFFLDALVRDEKWTEAELHPELVRVIGEDYEELNVGGSGEETWITRMEAHSEAATKLLAMGYPVWEVLLELLGDSPTKQKKEKQMELFEAEEESDDKRPDAWWHETV